MANLNKSVRVGVGVWIIHGRKALIGQRKGSHCPGETKEETDLDLDPATVKFVAADNNVMSNINKHYVGIFMSGNVKGSTDAKNMEPNKCERWVWVTKEELLDDKGPYRPLFVPLEKFINESDLTPIFA
ncbi:Nudix hydrolase 15, mitochondrial [Entomortierella chlamydospora]|uniref:Nudix hydrolase 15, mitochondrial n=1 Tax=Entomortierella chlamydospora TaxID=101097 RepID=A0A9P6T4W1_9FUNG|nr:Nudix hydrolase 15, mitochondrial [Entomortierella chlamydospora]